MDKLSVSIGGVKFKNPIIAAAGEPTTSFEHMKKAIEAGAGAVTAKSISFSPAMAKSYAHSRWAVLNERREMCKKGEIPDTFTFYGRSGIPLEAEDWLETLKKVKDFADLHNSVLIGSIATGPLDKMADAAKRMERAGIKILELDAGCPQAGELQIDSRLELVKSSDLAGVIMKEVAKAVSIPVIYKISPQDPDVFGTCVAVKEAGAAAVTLINRFAGFMVDIDKAEPVINTWGGVGGPWMLPISLKYVSRSYQAMPELPIVGSNGAADGKDAIRFLMSGATLVSYCTALMLKGYGVITKAVSELEGFIGEKGYGSVQDIIGLAVKNAKTYEEMFDKQKVASVDENKCTECGKCGDACFYGALHISCSKPDINEKCKGCGLCETACPTGAISLIPR